MIRITKKLGYKCEMNKEATKKSEREEKLTTRYVTSRLLEIGALGQRGMGRHDEMVYM